MVGKGKARRPCDPSTDFNLRQLIIGGLGKVA
jgi:hypothetical protein